MSATELSTLSLPDWAMPTSPRRETVDDHAIRIRQRWWQDAVASRKLPGPAPTASTLTRAEVWAADGEESRRDPERAYAILRPDRHNLITGLGPSFFTKFLYLREHCGWESLHRAGPWPADTYGRYCGLLARWAEEYDCAPDELERSLFAGERRAAA